MAKISPGPLWPPNFKPKWKEPKKTVAWPPVGYAKSLEVSGGSFWSIAKNNGRKNPWDIIIYNFQTDDPLEVNWYLHHAVGCYESNDGTNFMFGSPKLADWTIGKIYIPSSTWAPNSSFQKGSSAGRFLYAISVEAATMLNVLAARMPKITGGGTVVSGESMRTVANLITSREVSIDIAPQELGFYDAKYTPLFKEIKLARVPTRSSISMFGILANEATHVYNHFRGRSIRSSFREEVTSSIADGIAMASISSSYVERKLKMGPSFSKHMDATWFIGYAWLEKLNASLDVHDTDFDIEVAHPADGSLRNPLKQLKTAMSSIPDYRDKKGYGWNYIWNYKDDL